MKLPEPNRKYWWEVSTATRYLWSYTYGRGLGCYGSGFALSKARAEVKAVRKLKKLKKKLDYEKQERVRGTL